jgi:eukaryotic-like serine/threonine-protein kinase
LAFSELSKRLHRKWRHIDGRRRDSQSSRLTLQGVLWRVFLSILLLFAGAVFALPSFRQENDPLALSQPLTIKWRYDSDQTSNLTPASDGNMIYVPLAKGVLISLNVADGKLSWKAESGGEFSAAPTVDDRAVYAASQYSEPEQGHVHGTLRAISKATGVTLWMKTLAAPLKGKLAANDRALFAGGSDGRIYAFDKSTGMTIWMREYAEGFSSQPALAGNIVYFGGEKGTLFAIDQATGELKWGYRSYGAIQSPIVVTDGSVYFGSGDGYVYALSEPRPKLLWRRRTGAAVQSIAAVENGLLAASLDNFAYLLSRKGSLIWRRLLPGRISAQPVTAADGALFTPLSTDSAIVLNLRDGKPANALALGEENSSSAAPIVANNLVLITTARGLLAFSRPQAKPAENRRY